MELCFMFKEFYDLHICPHLIDFFMKNKVIEKQRLKVIPKAQGNVLEIGIGSGLNLDFYDKNKITRTETRSFNFLKTDKK